MKLSGVQVKSARWTAAKLDRDGGIKEGPRLTITLEMDGEDTDSLKDLLDYAQKGPCQWEVAPASWNRPDRAYHNPSPSLPYEGGTSGR